MQTSRPSDFGCDLVKFGSEKLVDASLTQEKLTTILRFPDLYNIEQIKVLAFGKLVCEVLSLLVVLAHGVGIICNIPMAPAPSLVVDPVFETVALPGVAE